jgi:hypothetical protein
LAKEKSVDSRFQAPQMCSIAILFESLWITSDSMFEVHSEFIQRDNDQNSMQPDSPSDRIYSILSIQTLLHGSIVAQISGHFPAHSIKHC